MIEGKKGERHGRACEKDPPPWPGGQRARIGGRVRVQKNALMLTNFQRKSLPKKGHWGPNNDSKCSGLR